MKTKASDVLRFPDSHNNELNASSSLQLRSDRNRRHYVSQKAKNNVRSRPPYSTKQQPSTMAANNQSKRPSGRPGRYTVGPSHLPQPNCFQPTTQQDSAAIRSDQMASKKQNKHPGDRLGRYTVGPSHLAQPNPLQPTTPQDGATITSDQLFMSHMPKNPLTEEEMATTDPYSYVYHGTPTTHRKLKERTDCPNCMAKRLQFECNCFCCMGRKVVLACTEIPIQLLQLYTSQNETGRLFRENIRSYNTNFSFASIGVSIDQTLSNMRYLQLYFFDPDKELSHRLQWENLDRTITQIIRQALATNPYAITFRHLGELGPLDNYRVTINASPDVDQRVYNRPTTSEVAGIWVEGNDNITAYKRSIVVYGRSEYPQTIQPYYGCYDPLSYPLFFPSGECGWHPDIPRQHIHQPTNQMTDAYMEEEPAGVDPETNIPKKNVAMREYYCYKFQMRPAVNLILLGGRLLQQFSVDVYIKIETARLQYYELNQPRIRAELYQGIVDCVNAGDVQGNKIGKRIVLPSTFIGGPRDMRRRFLDAMTLVHDDGKPDFFLTMTCNPQWPEISANLHPGQQAQDRPDVVSRVFRAKVEDLKELLFKKHLLGEVKSHVHVIEFQKRGLPHAHFLLIMHPMHRINSPEQYDKFVCAEIPNKQTYPQLHDVVVKHMMHGPCGSMRISSPCMEGEPKKCRFHYPRQFNEQTMQGEDAYPLYRRRNTGENVEVRHHELDNRWVVPYNPTLLMMFNCHINLEICSSIKSVKYLFKYVYKGHDKQVIHVDPDDNNIINEIKRFQDARYISPPEAMWRVFSFSLSQLYPAVLALQLHLPQNHSVTFSDNADMADIINRERHKDTMLTGFFKKNAQDSLARQHLYKDFPAHYTWNKTTCTWKERAKRPQRGRIVSANPAEGERYYLRLLLMHVRGPTSFNKLRTVQGIEHPTFRKAALEHGFIGTDNSLSECLDEASLFQFPIGLRRLFATILVFCEPGDVRKLWTDHFDVLSEDHQQHVQNNVQIQNMVLQEISSYLNPMGKKLTDFDLPPLLDVPVVYDTANRYLQDELSIPIDASHLQSVQNLNFEQQNVYNRIMHHVNNQLPGVFFIDGPGGTGKTFLYKALLAQVRSCGMIALATASSGVAANNMPGGRTSHSRFKIPLKLDNNSMCSISKQSGTGRLLEASRLIIWDEASMAKRQSIEAVDRTLQDITGNRIPFGGKVMVMGGDFRQVLPVIKKATRAQLVDASLRLSPLWGIIEKMNLTINMRAAADPWFAQFLLKVGDGTETTTYETYIRLPEDMIIPFTTKEESIKQLINKIFPLMNTSSTSPDYITSRAILTTKNENVDDINEYMIDLYEGEEYIYYSFDTAEDDQQNRYPTEFLNSLTVSGMPPHKLRLKKGCPIMLLRNIDPPNGLCNGTRLMCRAFQRNVIDAEIAVGEHRGKRVFIPRIPLSVSEEDMYPFKLKRNQFPIRLSFSMTINKAQGQTIPHVGIYLPESVFSHSQLYVALSRGTSRENTKVLVKLEKEFDDGKVYTSNIVYREVLQD